VAEKIRWQIHATITDNIFEYVKVLFRAATTSMHSTMLSGLLSVETTVCVANVVTNWSALSRSNQV